MTTTTTQKKRGPKKTTSAIVPDSASTPTTASTVPIASSPLKSSPKEIVEPVTIEEEADEEEEYANVEPASSPVAATNVVDDVIQSMGFTIYNKLFVQRSTRKTHQRVDFIKVLTPFGEWALIFVDNTLQTVLDPEESGVAIYVRHSKEASDISFSIKTGFTGCTDASVVGTALECRDTNEITTLVQNQLEDSPIETVFIDIDFMDELSDAACLTSVHDAMFAYPIIRLTDLINDAQAVISAVHTVTERYHSFHMKLIQQTNADMTQLMIKLQTSVKNLSDVCIRTLKLTEKTFSEALGYYNENVQQGDEAKVERLYINLKERTRIFNKIVTLHQKFNGEGVQKRLNDYLDEVNNTVNYVKEKEQVLPNDLSS